MIFKTIFNRWAYYLRICNDQKNGRCSIPFDITSETCWMKYKLLYDTRSCQCFCLTWQNGFTSSKRLIKKIGIQ